MTTSEYRSPVASELHINVAIWAAAITAVLTVILFLYSLALRVAHKLYDRRIRKLRRTWWPLLATATGGVSVLEDIQQRSLTAKKIEILREWCRFRSLVRGDSTETMDEIAIHLDLVAFARGLLGKGSVSSKLLAIRALGYMRDRKSRSAIIAMLHDGNTAVSITAAVALVDISPAFATVTIIPLIGQRSDWPRNQVGQLLNLAGAEVVSKRLCHAIETSPDKTAVRMLMFAETCNATEVNTLCNRLLAQRTNPALLSAALKANRGQISKSIIVALCRHDVWFVRMQAATALGQYGRRDEFKILEPLLSDTEWWVRYRAAQAIVNLPFMGPNALRKLRDRQKDRYARDIMQQALAERAMA